MNDAVDWHTLIARDFDAKYASSPSFRERLGVWSGLIEQYINPDSDVLDAGCGSGIMAALAAKRGRSVLAFDASPAMIDLAKARKAKGGLANTEFTIAPLGDPAIAAGRLFDVILCSSVLEYVEDWGAAFDWLADALKPDGTIIFSMPNGASLYRKAERLAFAATGRPAYYAHVRNVPAAAEVDALLRDREFSAISRRYYAAAPFASALARRVGCPQFADNLFVTVCQRAR